MAGTERITSRDNQRLTDLRKVRDGKDRSRIFIEGLRLSSEAVRSGLIIDACFVADSFKEMGEFRDLHDRTTAVADGLFAAIADTKHPQGIILTAIRPTHTLESLYAPDAIAVYLNKINNPSNLGAVMRAAEAAGAAGILTSPGSVDAFLPKSLRASMGSAFRLPIVQNVPLIDAHLWAKENGMTCVAADISGEMSYTAVDWNGPRLLVLGSEAHGLSDKDLNLIDDKIVIPMLSGVESLNLAVSAAVILFEAARQRSSN
jgi:TrmH family RNA methyltransferase